jgi:hypothetical protein
LLASPEGAQETRTLIPRCAKVLSDDGWQGPLTFMR